MTFLLILNLIRNVKTGNGDANKDLILNISIMTKKETYDFIEEFVISLYSKRIKLSPTALNAILKDGNAAYNRNRRLCSGIGAAVYLNWKSKDPLFIMQ